MKDKQEFRILNLGFRVKKNAKKLILLSLTLYSIFYILYPVAYAVTAEELKQAIQDKIKAQEAINAKLLETQKQLSATQNQKNSLSREIKRIDYTINQLNLGIKASQINMDKLNLEISALQLDIADINNAIGVKKAAVIELLRELYRKDRQGLLAVVLNHRSLAASFREGQIISDLNSGLAIELQNLKELNANMNAKINLTTQKRQSVQSENQNLKAKKDIVGDQKSEQQTLLAKTKNQEKLYQAQLSELEKKQDEISADIDQIEEELRKNFNYTLLPAKRPGMFIWPVENPIITQHFGEITRYKGRLLYNGKPHNGMDLGVPIGSPIFSVYDGTVTAVGNNGRYQYGKYVLVHHDNNLATLYAHLSRNDVVRVGDRVTQGQLIGRSGNTGYSFGAHLHLGLYWDDPSLGRGVQLQNLPNCNCGLVPIGIVVDPEDYLPSH